MSKFNWEIKKKLKNSNARLGIISTPHGIIETPAFIFCATKAALKSFTTKEAKENNTQIILSNTYHLMLQPGSNIIAKHGGLHKFIGWDGPMLTDSGGFQIFSLGHGSVADEIKGKKSNKKIKKTLLNINEEGAIFKSYVNGSNLLLTPEKSIQIQRNLGADLIVVFDECTPFNVSKDYTSRSMYRSHRWAKRSVNAFNSYLDVLEFQINKELLGANDESTSTAALTVIVPLISVERTTCEAAIPACVTLITFGEPAAACTTTFAITSLPLV